VRSAAKQRSVRDKDFQILLPNGRVVPGHPDRVHAIRVAHGGASGHPAGPVAHHRRLHPRLVPALGSDRGEETAVAEDSSRATLIDEEESSLAQDTPNPAELRESRRGAGSHVARHVHDLGFLPHRPAGSSTRRLIGADRASRRPADGETIGVRGRFRWTSPPATLISGQTRGMQRGRRVGRL
jgi:hypothetical protein